MANVKVRVLDAVVAGNRKGSEISIDERSAKHLASIGYVEILPEEKPAKQESAPKAEAPSGKDADKPKAPRKRASKDDK